MLKKLKYRAHTALRWSERYTKTDMVYVAEGGFWVVVGQAVAILGAIPLTIAFANLVTPHTYGVYKYILSVSAVVGAFSLTGLTTAVNRAAARDYDGSLEEASRLNLRWSLFMIVAALTGAAYYAFRENYTLAGGMALIAVFLPLLNGGNLYASFLNGKREFRVNTLFNNYRVVIHTAVILACLYFFREPLPILSAYFGIQAATSLYFHRKTVLRYVKNNAVDPALAHFSKHVSVINIFLTVADKLDSLLLFQFVGSAELAIYSFAEMIPDVINRATKSLTSLALPKFAVRTDASGIMKKTFLASLAVLPGVLLYILFAPYIFELFFPAYMESVLLSQVLALSVLLYGGLPASYVDAQAAIKKKYVLNISSSIVRIVLTLGGVLLYGLWGAVIARILSKIFGLGLVFYLIRK